MKEKIMGRLPFIFAYYTIISVISCVYNLLAGNSHIQLNWFLELFAFLVIFVLFDELLGRINFKSDFTFVLAETGVAYLLFLLFGYFFHWISFTPGKLLGATILFLLCVVLGVTYLTYRNKLRAKELNDMIQKKNR